MKPKANRWPRQVQPGRAIVTVYRYKNESKRRRKYGDFIYLIVSPSSRRNQKGKAIRQWNRYVTEAEALAAAESLAKRRDELGDFANNLTPNEAIEYASANKALHPFGIS